jgi:hypothetical protein
MASALSVEKYSFVMVSSRDRLPSVNQLARTLHLQAWNVPVLRNRAASFACAVTVVDLAASRSFVFIEQLLHEWDRR